MASAWNSGVNCEDEFESFAAADGVDVGDRGKRLGAWAGDAGTDGG